MTGQPTSLRALLALRNSWAEDHTIFVMEPWEPESDALISLSTDQAGLISRQEKTYAYFLEGFIARDFLKDLGVPAGDVDEGSCRRLIAYAINDA